MDMRERLIRPSSTFDRVSWLVVAPTASALTLVVLVGPNLPYDLQSDLPKRGPFVLASSIPMLGALCAFGYGMTMHRIRPLLYLLPFGLLSAVSTASGVLLAAKNQDPEHVARASLLGVAPLVSAVSWVLMPYFALIGGLLALSATKKWR